MADTYSRKMIRVPSYALLREQDQGKMPVLDVAIHFVQQKKS